MYATVFKADPLDPERGRRYRDKILYAGGSREEWEILKVKNCFFRMEFAIEFMSL